MPSQDKLQLGQGQQIFMTYCAPCHRPDGGGLVGPNLCDDYWIHGGSPLEIHTTIDQGVLVKGGAEVHFSAATGTKGLGRSVLTVIDESATPHQYFSVSFRAAD